MKQELFLTHCREYGSLGHLVFQSSVFCYHPPLPDQPRPPALPTCARPPPTPKPAPPTCLSFMCLLGYLSIGTAIVLVAIISSLSFLLSMY